MAHLGTAKSLKKAIYFVALRKVLPDGLAVAAAPPLQGTQR